MNAPPLLLAAEVLSEGSPVTIGLACGLVVVAVAWGESRVHISSLREWKREAEVKIAKLELAQGRTDEQLSSINKLLTEVRGMVLQLLQGQGRNVS